MLPCCCTRVVLLLYLFIRVTSSTLCPNVVGQGHLQDTGGLEAYLDTADADLQSVAGPLGLFADSDGRIRVIGEGGVVHPLFSNPGGTAFPIPSSVGRIPIHLTANRELYYSFSVISPNEGIIGPFTNVTPNTGIITPGEVINTTVEFCCKDDGTLVMQGCLTVGDRPFTELRGDYVTLGPFYASYHCAEDHVRTDCPKSLPLFIVISEFCFTRNFTRALVESGEGSWGLFISAFVTLYCAVTVDRPDGLAPLLQPDTNPNIPIGAAFPSIDSLLMTNTGYRWAGPVGYSFVAVSRMPSIVDNPINITISFGQFESSNLGFFIDVPCLEIGVTIIDIAINFSSILDGIVFNNSYSFYFHRSCTPIGFSPPTDPPSKSSAAHLVIILPSTIVPVVVVLVVVMVVALVLFAITRREKEIVEHLEGLAKLDNPYILHTVQNPFEFLDEYNLEYNFALLEVVDKLGEGCFGHVYKAIAPGLTDDFVAVKTLKDDCDGDTLRLFAKEVGVCVNFKDTNVIKLLAVCAHSVQKCMIFEYMDLGGLDGLLRKSSPQNPEYDSSESHLLIPDQFLDICQQLVRGLVHLSTLNFVHRDIAARNCLMDSNFRAKIADFGLSRNISAQNYYRIGNGKNYLPIRWMPPEALFYGTFTLQSDVWSFGVLMWEIYTYGQLPFGGLSNHEVIDNIKASKILDKPELCPLGVYHIMHSCWTRVPSKRPTIARVLQRLEQFGLGTTDHSSAYVNLLPQEDPTDIAEAMEQIAQSSSKPRDRGLVEYLVIRDSPVDAESYAELSPTALVPQDGYIDLSPQVVSIN